MVAIQAGLDTTLKVVAGLVGVLGLMMTVVVFIASRRDRQLLDAERNRRLEAEAMLQLERDAQQERPRLQTYSVEQMKVMIREQERASETVQHGHLGRTIRIPRAVGDDSYAYEFEVPPNRRVLRGLGFLMVFTAAALLIVLQLIWFRPDQFVELVRERVGL